MRLGVRFSEGEGGPSGSGLRPVDGAASGRGLRAGLTIIPQVDTARSCSDIPGVAEIDGLAAVVDGDGDALGGAAGELRDEDNDFRDGVAGCGVERKIARTSGILSPGTLSLINILGFF